MQYFFTIWPSIDQSSSACGRVYFQNRGQRAEWIGNGNTEQTMNIFQSKINCNLIKQKTDVHISSQNLNSTGCTKLSISDNLWSLKYIMSKRSKVKYNLCQMCWTLDIIVWEENQSFTYITYDDWFLNSFSCFHCRGFECDKMH